MTNTYNTGNPLGSTDPRDLLDNASNLDDAMNSAAATFTDRLGVQRDTWAGQENTFDLSQAGREAEFQQFLTDSGFVSLGNYAPGLNFTAYNQYMARDGFFYRPAPSSIPFTTTGTWVGGDEDLFNLFSADDVLRQDLADDTDPVKGAALVGWTRSPLSDTINNVHRALDSSYVALWEFADAITVKPNPADPTTWDWTPAFVACFASAPKVVRLPRHEITTSAVITLPFEITIQGENSWLNRFISTIRATHSGYVFQAPASGGLHTFKDFSIQSVSGLDLRATAQGVYPIADVDNISFKGGDGTGVAVHMMNHSFSKVTGCNFFAWTGYCAVRNSGWFDGATYGNNEASTQVRISKNILSATQLIGISVDIVDSIHIYENDVQACDYPVDVGGQRYFENVPGPTGYYKRGSGNPTTLSWPGGPYTFQGFGWFSNVLVHSNHFEDNTVTVTGNGQQFEHNMNLRVYLNNVFFRAGNLAAFELTKCIAASVKENDTDYRTHNTTPNIIRTNTTNLEYMWNRFHSSEGAVSTAEFAGSANSGEVTVIHASGATKQTPANPITSVIRVANFAATDAQSVKGTVAAIGNAPAKGIDTLRKIGVTASLALNAQMNLTPVVSEHVSGIVILDVTVAGVGRTSSTWAVGRSSVVRISNEASTTSLYVVKYNAGNTQLVLESLNAATVTFSANGIAMLIGVV